MNTLPFYVVELTRPIAIEILLKSSVLLGLALVITALLRRRSPAMRHLVWTLALASIVALPLLAAGLPGWRVSVGDAPVAHGESGVLSSAASAALSSTEVSPTVEPSRVENLVSSFPGSFAPPLFMVWLTGCCAVLAWVLTGRVMVSLVARRSTQPGPEWHPIIRDTARVSGLTRTPRALVSRAGTVPFTYGSVRPTIVVPEEARAWPVSKLRVVLLHECAHIARRDVITQALGNLACALYWFHPGVWFAARRLRIERERACDDLVIAAGTRRSDYARYLLDVASSAHGSLRGSLVALAMAKPSALEGRLLAILHHTRSARPAGRRVAWAGAFVAFALTTPLAAVNPVLRASVVRSSTPLTFTGAPLAFTSAPLAFAPQTVDTTKVRSTKPKPATRTIAALQERPMYSIPSGRIQLSDVTRGGTFRTGDGDIYLGRTIGPVELTTSAGHIRVESLQESHHTYQLTAGAHIDVSNISGPVSVEATDGLAAEVHIYRTAPNRDDLAYRKVYVEQTSSGLIIQQKDDGTEHSSINLLNRVVLKLPRQVSVSGKSISGDFNISGVTGAVDLNGISGSVDAKRLNGALTVSGASGNVRLAVERINDAGLRVSNVSGSIYLRLASDLNADLSITNTSGGVSNTIESLVLDRSGASGYSARFGTGGPRIVVSNVTGAVALGRISKDAQKKKE